MFQHPHLTEILASDRRARATTAAAQHRLVATRRARRRDSARTNVAANARADAANARTNAAAKPNARPFANPDARPYEEGVQPCGTPSVVPA